MTLDPQPLQNRREPGDTADAPWTKSWNSLANSLFGHQNPVSHAFQDRLDVTDSAVGGCGRTGLLCPLCPWVSAVRHAVSDWGRFSGRSDRAQSIAANQVRSALTARVESGPYRSSSMRSGASGGGTPVNTRYDTAASA